MLIQIPNQHLNAALVKLGAQLDLNSLGHLVIHQVGQFSVLEFINDGYSRIDRSVLEILLQSPELEAIEMKPTSFHQHLEANPQLEQQMSMPSQASPELISFITDLKGYFFRDYLDFEDSIAKTVPYELRRLYQEADTSLMCVDIYRRGWIVTEPVDKLGRQSVMVDLQAGQIDAPHSAAARSCSDRANLLESAFITYQRNSQLMG